MQLLDQMEWHMCQPDKEVHDIIVNIFGDWNFSTRKIKRMLYWMPKLKHTNHYLDRRDVEGKALNAMELARLALKTMCRDSGTQFTYLKVPCIIPAPPFNINTLIITVNPFPDSQNRCGAGGEVDSKCAVPSTAAHHSQHAPCIDHHLLRGWAKLRVGDG